MDARATKSIEAILEAYDRQQQIARREMERRKAEREEFLASFAETTRTVIRPVMEQTGLLMQRSGHGYEIIEHEEGRHPNGLTYHASIRLRIFPNGERPQHDIEETGWPHAAMIVNPARDTVLAHESAMMPNVGGPFGTTGEYRLEEITAEVVEQHIVSVLSKAMGIGRRMQRAPKRPKRSKRPRQPDLIEPPMHTATGEQRIDAAFTYLSGPLDGQS